MRVAEIKRTTAETEISLKINLDGKGKSKIDTGCGFLDHMLTLFSKHGRFDLNVKCKGAFSKALGNKKGIIRYGNAIIPMDEALILTAVDISGRSFFVKDINIPATKVGDFDTELVEEFLLAFVRTADCTLHVRQLSGSNSHHVIEGIFKSLARSLKQAVAIDPSAKDEVPSTKGVL